VTTRRNPIRRLGDAPRRDFTKVPNELARDGPRQLGPDGFALMVLLLSHADGWGTSAVDVSRQLGWGQNRQRAAAAFEMLAGDGRLVIREHRRDGGGCVRREYVFHADARRFADEEVEKWSVPIIVAGRGVHGNRAGSHGLGVHGNRAG
jgi:hypothetical protein